MSALIRFELKKMLGNRKGIILLCAVFLLNLLSLFQIIQSQIHYFGQIKAVNGLDAIHVEQQYMKKLKGPLTDEFIAHVESTINRLESDPANLETDEEATKAEAEDLEKRGYSKAEIAKIPPAKKVKDSVYINEIDQYDFIGSTIGIQSLQAKIITQLEKGGMDPIYQNTPGFHDPNAPKPAKTPALLQKLLEMYQKVRRPFYNDYYDGWFNFCFGYSEFAAIILGAAVVILLSPVFSGEYSAGMDGIILSSKYGKNKTIKAKLLVSSGFTVCLYVISALLNSILYAAFFGVTGSGCNIQVNGNYMVSPYPLTYLQLYWAVLLMGLIGSLLLCAVTIFISAKCRSPFLSLILSAVVLYLPAVNLSGISLSADKILKLFPIHLLSSPALFETGIFYNLFGHPIPQPIVMVGVAAICSAAFFFAAYRSFRQHQAA